VKHFLANMSSSIRVMPRVVRERVVKSTVLGLVVALTLASLAMWVAAEAQQPGRVARIGVLSPGDPLSEPSARFEAFRQELRERGWVEGQNIAIEWRFAGGKNDRLPDLAAELIRLKVDVIFAINTPATQAARNAISTVPIVFTGVGASPTVTQLVDSLARPGGNITGITTVSGEMSGKRLELMKEVLPKVRRVAVLWHAPNAGAAAIFKDIEAAAVRLGLRIQNVGVPGPNEIRNAFDAATRERAGALVLIDDMLISSHRGRILELAGKNRLPVISIYSDFVEAGGLIAYGPKASDTYQRAAYFIDRILKGVKPGDLPVEQSSTFELVINLKAAKTLGLTVPPSPLLRADRLIE
jgi:putative ABC transport system substrate-binding protein